MRVLVAMALAVGLGCGGAAPAPAQPAPAATSGQPSAGEPTVAAASAATEPEQAGPSIAALCQVPERRQFDFWLGTWEVRTADRTIAGHNVIAAIAGGCAVHEQWTSARGGTGASVNAWDPGTRQWVQHWVDAQGGVLDMTGGLDGNVMKLEGRYVAADGTESRLRGAWTPLPDGRVRQRFEQTTDGGKTWSVWFDGYYSRTPVR